MAAGGVHVHKVPGNHYSMIQKPHVAQLAQVLAAELGTGRIRVNALLPGGTKTAMAGDSADVHDFVAGLHALKRMADPQEIAQAALFLASDQSSFVTGTALLADGGVSINRV